MASQPLRVSLFTCLVICNDDLSRWSVVARHVHWNRPSHITPLAAAEDPVTRVSFPASEVVEKRVPASIDNDVSSVAVERLEAETSEEQKDLFMRYSEKLNLVVCSCAKCGSTSMYKYMYAKLFGQAWPYRNWPWMQDVWTDRWNYLFALYDNPDEQRTVMERNDTFSFALIRDPKERLISAWKSKAACEEELYDSDTGEGREHLLQNLVELQGLPASEAPTCLSLRDFVESLHTIHTLGKERYLDRHVLPQNLGCFNRFPPGQWSKVTTVSNSTGFAQLSETLGTQNEELPKNDHFSTATVEVTPEVADMLDTITADEYAELGPYLAEPSRVTSGSYVFAVHRLVTLDDSN